MPPEPSLLPAFVFGLFVIGTFVAFLWYPCGLRYYRLKEREEEKRLSEERRLTELQFEEEYRLREFRIPEAVHARLQRMRENEAHNSRTVSVAVCSTETRAEIRKAVANAAFFKRRRKA